MNEYRFIEKQINIEIKTLLLIHNRYRNDTKHQPHNAYRNMDPDAQQQTLG